MGAKPQWYLYKMKSHVRWRSSLDLRAELEPEFTLLTKQSSNRGQGLYLTRKVTVFVLRPSHIRVKEALKNRCPTQKFVTCFSSLNQVQWSGSMTTLKMCSWEKTLSIILHWAIWGKGECQVRIFHSSSELTCPSNFNNSLVVVR